MSNKAFSVRNWRPAAPSRGASLNSPARDDDGEELRDRILLGITEINAEPVVHRWKKFDMAENKV